MRIKNLFKIAFKSLLTNKTRALLTSLGIIIGVTAVILLIGIGTGLQSYVTQQFENLGSNIVYVMPGKLFNEEGGFSNNYALTSLDLNQNDLRNLERSLGEDAIAVVPLISTNAQIKFRNRAETSELHGSEYIYSQVLNLNPVIGRFYDQADQSSGRRVVVIGYDLQEKLFGSVDPLGKEVQLGGERFEVIGVIEKKGGSGSLGTSLDTQTYIPISTAERVFNRRDYSAIIIKVASQDKIDSVIKTTKKVLRQRFSSDEFSVVDQTQILSAVTGILSALTAGIGGIAAISLLVGGIGISNIMLVTVTERTREIGLRKAVGATPRIILIQFLIESMLLSFNGGLIGIILGFLGCLAMQNFFPAQISFWSVALAFGVSAAIGIVFGLIPARRAAKLSPINALRYE